MSTQPTNPAPPSVDDAFAAFKSAEAALVTDQTGLSTAQSALAAAQAAVTSAQSTVTADTQTALAAATALQQALAAYIANLQPPAATSAGRASHAISRAQSHLPATVCPHCGALLEVKNWGK